VQHQGDAPEDEDEQDEQSEEHCDIVHCSEHDDKLVTQRWHEPDQLEDSQETKCPQDRQTSRSALQQLHQTIRSHTTKSRRGRTGC